jgi:NAD(P)-dependent dehydrogenase (short-subunit alcohol dehydrogenase family)
MVYRRGAVGDGITGLRVVVTGAASGIGAATAGRFVAGGARVAGIDLDRAGLDSADLDAQLVADVADAEELAAAVDAAAVQLGGLDAVVASAGVAGRGTAADTLPGEWERIFAVNVRGVYLTARAAIPHLRRAGGGAIVNVASQLGLVAAANAAAYCASKGAVVQLTRAMAVDHGPEGIRVNCVCPGPTDTPLLEPYFAGAPDPAAERAAYEGAQVHGRLVTAEEVADAIVYLASPSAASTIGIALVVDGGYTIR